MFAYWFNQVLVGVMLVIVLTVVAAIVFYLVASARQKWHDADTSARR